MRPIKKNDYNVDQTVKLGKHFNEEKPCWLWTFWSLSENWSDGGLWSHLWAAFTKSLPGSTFRSSLVSVVLSHRLENHGSSANISRLLCLSVAEHKTYRSCGLNPFTFSDVIGNLAQVLGVAVGLVEFCYSVWQCSSAYSMRVCTVRLLNVRMCACACVSFLQKKT